MSNQVLIINGPNLGRLGSRQVEIYGTVDHAELARRCIAWGAELGFAVSVRQTDSEAELLAWLHQAGDSQTPVILNAGAFTHYSYAIGDAVADLRGRGARLIEVHISNPAAREHFRHNSVISANANGVIAGFGVDSYHLALLALAK
jgi:3-dehydroquinate dehydratase-2